MKHIKVFTTQAEVATYEQSQQYIEPYIGASYDSVAAHYNHNTPIYKQFYDYDDETHQYNLYEQVEYIENPSNAYIDTGIYGTMDLNFYIEFLPTVLATAYKSGAGSIFGSRSAYNSRAYQLTTYNKVSPYSASTRGHFLCANNYGWSDNKAPTANMLLNQKNIIKKENLIFTRADGSTFTLTSQTFTTAATITIFQCAGAGEPAKIKLYKLQFSKNGNILRDFIPVKRINDNVYGLWDRANSKFYVSPNGTQFTGGARMIYDTNDVQYQQVEYISNPNKGYINTGLYASSNTKVECSVKFTEISRSQAIFGCRTKDSTTQNSFVVWGLDSNTFRNDFIGTTNTVSGITVNTSTTYNITKQAGTLTVNNNSSATITGTLTNNSTTLYIFNVHQPNPSASQYFTGKLYYFKVYNSNTLMRDFIPVKRISDSKYGVFDLVNRVFYTAGNNIEFTGA